MQIEQLIQAMSPAVYEILKQAVETGKWPNGIALEADHKPQATQAMMLYQGTHLEQTDHFTIGKNGVFNNHSKSQLRRQFRDEESIVTVKLNDN